MESEMCLHTTYKRPCIRIIICSFELSNVQRVWFGTNIPISYTVIPGKNFCVHILTSSPLTVLSSPLSQLTDKPRCGQL